MSKKTISFSLPSSRPQAPERDSATARDFDFERAGDAWVLAAQAETARDEASLVIDLTAKRSWFELMCLISAFPYIAAWAWTAQTLQSLGRTSDR
jgi:hypothetical protein